MSTNPFQKSTEKPSALTVTLSPEQRQVVDQLRDHLELRTASAVMLAGLAALWDQNHTQLEKAGPTA